MPALHPRFWNRALPICVLALVVSMCLPEVYLGQLTYNGAVPVLRSMDGHNATATGDFDGDGDEDIVTTASGIQLIANIGNGTFLMPTSLQGSNTTIYRSIEAVDLDLDGDLDLLVTSQDTDEVGWLENDGAANFSLFQLISNELNDPTRAFAADLDNDGDLDVVTSSHSDNKVTWFERTAGNTFDGPHIVVSNANGAECVYAADLDGDGLKDIMVAARWANRVAWYKNLGGNDFSGTNLISSTAEGARWVDAQDLDGDGDLDVLSASGADDTLQWFENAGDGTFSAGNVLSSSSSGARVIVAKDFDGDGDLDIAGVSENDSKIRYFRNDGGGAFASAATIGVLGGRHITTADLNGDGLPDFVGVSCDFLAYSIYNLGLGIFGGTHRLTGIPDTINKMAIGDANNDGLQDIFYGTVWSDELGVLIQHASGGYQTVQLAPWSLNNPRPQALVDMNQDGQLDLLFTASLNHAIYWSEIGPNGEFEELHVVGSGFYQVNDAIYLDLENDGDLDVVATSLWGDGLTLFENSGNEEFVEHTDFLTADQHHKSIQALDMNADGLMDVVTREVFADAVYIFTNLGGNFEESIAISTISPFDIEIGDINNDGHLDIVVSSDATWSDPSTPRVQVWQNDGDGGFSNSLPLPGIPDSGIVWSIELSDLDNDGFLDIILNPTSGGSQRSWMKNTGDGTFLAREEFGPGYGIAEFVMVDMDDDNDLDIVSFDSAILYYTENNLNPGCMNSDACNFNPSAAVEDGSCCFVDCGCTNSNALNFIASATCDDNSCEFQTGCTNADASNYNSEALVEDGSCTFLVSGHVFDDLNENGIWNTNEYALAYRNVQVPALGINLITNDEGQFQANLPPGAFEIYVAFDPNLPYNTTLNPVVVVVDDDPQTGIVFGISKEMPLFGICVDLYPSAGGLCDAPRNFNICYRNMSNLPIDGIIELHPDPLFQGFVPVNEVDSVVENTIYLSFENLNPGQMYMYDIALITPTVEYIGEELYSTVDILGFYEGSIVASGAQENTTEVTCAYDPNDKLVFPNGHTDDHLILQETHLEYLIRFQNTGNAPAFDVLLRDTIDDNLDMSTFTLMANSHSVMTSLNEETREVTFFFENILLPDSAADEPGSHGLASYKIRPYPNLEVGTEITNTAYIFFDNNPPVVTNTTWSTIHECTEDHVLTISTEVDCPGLNTTVSSAYVSNPGWQEFFNWEIDGVQVGSDEVLSLGPDFIGEGPLALTVSNPLCEETASSTIVLEPGYRWATCPGDLNCDLECNSTDVITFLGEFACLGPACKYDLNGDDQADSVDLLSILGWYGSVCE